MFIFPTQLLVLPSGQALMQEALAGDSLVSETYPEAFGEAFEANSSQPNYHLPAGSVLTGTALLSTGLIASLVGNQPALTPTGEAFIPQQTAHQPSLQGLYSQDYAQAIALDRGTGISPQVALAPPVAFSQQPEPQLADHSGTAYTEADAATPIVTQQSNDSWTLAYSQPSAYQPAISQQSAATQALVRQLAQSSSGASSGDASFAGTSQFACLASSCQSLAYVEKSLPEAQHKVLDIQKQLDAFAVQHAQSDMQTYRTVLASRRSEIAQQESQTMIDLSGTERYIAQIQVRLTDLDVAPGLANHVLAVDANYQADWQALQLIESRLLAEFSAVNVDGTALNKIYTDYESRQRSLYQSAQDALGSYLLAENSQATTSQASDITAAIHQAPVAVDLLQALVIATHQQDIQQLRLKTARTVTSKLHDRQRNLAENMTQYESLQRELVSTQALVTQYEQSRADISKNAIATTEVVNSMRAKIAAEAQRDGAVSAAQTLEAQLPKGSIAKTLLGIVAAAGAVAVAIKRTHGDLSEDVTLEIAPQFGPQDRPQLGHLPWGKKIGTDGSFPAKRLTNPFNVDWMSQLLDITGSPTPALAAQGPAFSSATGSLSGHSFGHSFGPVSHLEVASTVSPLGRQSLADTSTDPNIGTELAIEVLSRELTQMIQKATPEGDFATVVSDRAIESVKLSLADLDDFAEEAVRWVLHDAESFEAKSSEPAAALHEGMENGPEKIMEIREEVIA